LPKAYVAWQATALLKSDARTYSQFEAADIENVKGDRDHARFRPVRSRQVQQSFKMMGQVDERECPLVLLGANKPAKVRSTRKCELFTLIWRKR
jgi:hypothetical protein